MKRSHLEILVIMGILVLGPAVASAASPRSSPPSRSLPRAPSIIDNTAHMDANNLDMIVTNHGSLAYDLITGSAGLIYPKGSTRTVVFASGPWMGARVGPFSELRI